MRPARFGAVAVTNSGAVAATGTSVVFSLTPTTALRLTGPTSSTQSAGTVAAGGTTAVSISVWIETTVVNGGRPRLFTARDATPLPDWASSSKTPNTPGCAGAVADLLDADYIAELSDSK